MRRHELTDDEWATVAPLLPVRPGPVSKRGDRNFLNAVLWRTRTGTPWRDLPERYGSWKTIYNRFARWASAGTWKEIFRALRVGDEVASLVDATVVRAHQDAAGGKGGSDTTRSAARAAGSPAKSMRSRRRTGSRFTSSSRRGSNTKQQSQNVLSRIFRDAPEWRMPVMIPTGFADSFAVVARSRSSRPIRRGGGSFPKIERSTDFATAWNASFTR